MIHVGPQKTGSTSIQTFMGDAKYFMENKDHYWVSIVPGRDGVKNTAELAVCLNKDVTMHKKRNNCANGKNKP